MEDKFSLLERIIAESKHPKSTSEEIGTRCPVHEVDLKIDAAPKSLICVYDAEYQTAGRTLFPYAHRDVLRQCLGGGIPGEGETEEGLFCPKCKEAEAIWLSSHAKRVED